MHLLYELVGREAEPFVSWSCPAPGAPAERLPVNTDAREALAHMLTQQKWQEARRYAAMHRLPAFPVEHPGLAEHRQLVLV